MLAPHEGYFMNHNAKILIIHIAQATELERLRLARQPATPAKAKALAALAREGVEYRLERVLARSPSRAESACFSRELQALEAAGLLERWHFGYSARTTAVRLTPAGEALAVSLRVADTDAK